MASVHLILMLLLIAKSSITGAQEDEFSQQTGIVAQEDEEPPIPVDVQDAEVIGEGQLEGLPERISAIEDGSTPFPDEYRPVGGDVLANEAEESSAVESRLDVDEEESPVKESAVPRCLQEKSPGMCRAYFPRWYYNSANGTCQEFVFGGCGANDNNFVSEMECQAACPDVVVCPEDPEKTCRVSESACMSSFCSEQVDVICRVTPCTCAVTFVDYEGHEVICDEPLVPPTIPAVGSDDKDDGIAGDKAPRDEDDTDTSGDWKIPTFVAIGIVALVGAVIVTWVVLRRRARRSGIHYTAAPSGKDSQQAESPPSKTAQEQCNI